MTTLSMEFPVIMKVVRIEFSNHEVWDIPVLTIANHRAEHYKGEFGDDLDRSLREDTLPLFQASDYEITDWATGNLNWDDVIGVAQKRPDAQYDVDKVAEWASGERIEVIMP